MNMATKKATPKDVPQRGWKKHPRASEKLCQTSSYRKELRNTPSYMDNVRKSSYYERKFAGKDA